MRPVKYDDNHRASGLGGRQPGWRGAPDLEYAVVDPEKAGGGVGGAAEQPKISKQQRNTERRAHGRGAARSRRWAAEE